MKAPDTYRQEMDLRGGITSIMKQVHICSLKQLQNLFLEHKIDVEHSCAIISTSYPIMMKEIKSMRHIVAEYDDVDFESLGRSLSPEIAAKIARFIMGLEDTYTDYWFVCDGGVRRSAALACATLRAWLGREAEELAIWGDYRWEPNIWCYVLLSSALGSPVSDTDLDLRIHLNREAIRSAIQGKKKRNK